VNFHRHSLFIDGSVRTLMTLKSTLNGSSCTALKQCGSIFNKLRLIGNCSGASVLFTFATYCTHELYFSYLMMIGSRSKHTVASHYVTYIWRIVCVTELGTDTIKVKLYP
jgi:hypothetical protein